jgi:hypothetical protein
VQTAENLRREASGVKTPEEVQRLTAGLKPRPSNYSAKRLDYRAAVTPLAGLVEGRAWQRQNRNFSG